MDYTELVKSLREYAADGYMLFTKMGEAMAQAADTIEELISKLNHADEAIVSLVDAAEERRWISVEERLPEPYIWVLVYAEKHKVAFDAFYDGAQWKDAVLNGLIVTHWMPLPEPPKEET